MLPTRPVGINPTLTPASTTGDETWLCEGGNCFEHPLGTFPSQADCESKCGHSPRKNPEDDEISRIKGLF